MPNTSKIAYVQYKTIDEPWNTYELEDGTTIRVRLVLGGLIKESDADFSVQTTRVFNVIPDGKYIGVPSPPMKPTEKVEDYIEADDLKVLKKTDNWNEYELDSEKIRLSIKGELVSVSRTSRHDHKGIPIYVIDIQLLVKHKKIKGE